MRWQLVILLFVCISCTQKPVFKLINNDELKTLMKQEDLQIIDVRTPEEVSFGVIENSKHIDFYNPNFRQEINQLDKSKPTVLYCAAGGRSAQASEIFKKAGFIELYDLTGGYRGWKAQN